MSYLELALKVAKSGRKAHASEPECAARIPDAEESTSRQAGQSYARLFPFIDKQVWTPSGTGRLFTAYAEDCEVILDSTGRVVRVRTEDVLPMAIQ